ncbi:AroM family protein [Bacillus sp. AFS002410]|uniref:AroM family protein n=1 Tax=Bacillus sp. AFS002410 TaxID=2033481 RepID=UPI0015CF7859|nr:AroM family protein [Bacillus sp. AFS002410]
MTKLGMITIGQAPRHDMASVIEKHLNGHSEIVQVGVLDGFTKELIEEQLSPDFGDYILTTRLINGDSVVMSRKKMQSIMQDKINLLETMGIKQILLLCTGEFPGLQTNISYLIEPDQIIPSAVKAILGQRRLGVIIPLAEQVDSIKNKFSQFGMNPYITIASPYKNDLKNFEKAAKELKGKVDLILLDCMAYQEQSRGIVSQLTDLPVIVSNVIMAKLVSEMI